VHKFSMNKLADNLLCRLQHVIPLHLLVLPSAAQFSGSLQLVHSRGERDFVKENINNPFVLCDEYIRPRALEISVIFLEQTQIET
jgi:hypothetical protein